MNLTVLGCGDAFGNGGRNNTSFLLSDQEESILIDCGATTLVRLKEEEVDLDQVSTIVITHFHGDHYGGIPFLLISCLFELNRKAPLTIIGPKHVENKVYHLLEAMYPDTAERVKKLDLTFIEFEEGVSLEVKGKIVQAYRVEHSPPSNPHGIRLQWKDKVFAFSGDTSWTDSLIPLSEEADLFICECNFFEETRYGHLSYEELLRKQLLFKCENIWLTHMDSDMLSRDGLIFNRLEDGLRLAF